MSLYHGDIESYGTELYFASFGLFAVGYDANAKEITEYIRHMFGGDALPITEAALILARDMRKSRNVEEILRTKARIRYQSACSLLKTPEGRASLRLAMLGLDADGLRELL